MPRPRLNAPAPQLSHGQAAYVLERLIADRRISPGEVSRYVSDMHREISDLETRLNTLRTHAGASGTGSGSGGGTGSGATFGARSGRPPGRPPGRPAGSGVTASGKRRGRPPGSKNVASSASASASAAPSGGADAGSAPTGGKRRRRARITPEQLASRQLQGRYLGLIRQIPANKRGQYQKIAKDSGREAAINAMKSAVNR